MERPRVPSRSRSGSTTFADQSRGAGDAETSLSIQLWYPGGRSGLSKAPLLREVPQVKQKLSKRSSMQGRFDPTSSVTSDRSLSFKSATPSWLREKPSKARMGTPLGTNPTSGSWRKATLLFRESGVLSIYGEDRALLHSILCFELMASDVRVADESLFGRPNVLGIFSRPSSFLFSPNPQSNVSVSGFQRGQSLAQGSAIKEEPIFICFPTRNRLLQWKSLLKTFSQPEVYGERSSAATGGTHRCYRQIDMTIFDAKCFAQRATQSDPPPRRDSHGMQAAGGTDRAEERGRASLDFEESMARAEADLEAKRNKEALLQRKDPSAEGEQQEARQEGRLSRSSSAMDSNSEDNHSMTGGSWNDHPTGPISGISGAQRAAAGANPGSISASASAGSASLGQMLEREETESVISAGFDRYCLVVLNGEVVARTQPGQPSTLGTFSVEKFRLTDLPQIRSLTIEVMYTAGSAGSSSKASGISSTVGSQKYYLLGVVEMPVETLRRGEDVEGRFPIWSSFLPGGSRGVGDGETRGSMTTFGKDMVGELKMSIKMREEAILPLTCYSEIERHLNASASADLLLGLAKGLNEDTLVTHLVDVFASSGTITERIASLADHESSTWGERLEPELLFRGNTLLSRSIDKFQRMLGTTWLDSCVGPTVRKVCDEDFEGAAVPAIHGSDLAADSATTSRGVHLSGMASQATSAPEVNESAEALRKLSEELWVNIYAHRHQCPTDLRRILFDIRRKVNAKYGKEKSSNPGIQGVGAFVFLRLFCAALNAPQLYGLLPSQPHRRSQRRLLQLSKVLLALANKKATFDKDKDPEMALLDDFLAIYGSAFDDYITVISAEPLEAVPLRPSSLGDEEDQDLQDAVERRIQRLTPLHKESIPTFPYMLDRPLALASLVSFIVRAAEATEYGAVEGSDLSVAEESQEDDALSDQSLGSRGRSDIDRYVNHFIDLCCDLEDQAGFVIERAGFDPRPLMVRDVFKGASSLGESMVFSGVTSDLSAGLGEGRGAAPPLPRRAQLPRARSATVSGPRDFNLEDRQRLNLTQGMNTGGAEQDPRFKREHQRAPITLRRDDSGDSTDEDSLKEAYRSFKANPELSSSDSMPALPRQVSSMHRSSSSLGGAARAADRRHSIDQTRSIGSGSRRLPGGGPNLDKGSITSSSSIRTRDRSLSYAAPRSHVSAGGMSNTDFGPPTFGSANSAAAGAAIAADGIRPSASSTLVPRPGTVGIDAIGSDSDGRSSSTNVTVTRTDWLARDGFAPSTKIPLKKKKKWWNL
ncbi:hypothetical protein IE53DRAFT_360054 [Violaceomyces palustris]|uniref:Uncharacterized protein n=1 Tax=Violaceomyces palustris TaxID=1673888 RepID=A0ACD0P5X1_9BASI|nr:hypothetical protein IE53DRAFT_360054 [Violaceomyces palustris]